MLFRKLELNTCSYYLRLMGWKTKRSMERYILSDLKHWMLKSRRKPLLLGGARQVGKTWLVERLAQEEFQYYVKIDFEESSHLCSIFEVL